jgi:membrane dipeptidase
MTTATIPEWEISEAAARLHRDALVWDNHGCLPFENTEQWLNELARYRRAGVKVVSINIGDAQHPLDTLVRMAAHIRGFVQQHSDEYVLAATAADVSAAHNAGKLAVALDVEGAYALGEQLSLIQFYYDIGVRWMLMVYNRANLTGYGCHDESDAGLTAFGRRVVREMDRVGLVKCCAHTGYRTAMDVLTMTDRPTIFSHSNPRALRDHPRNIPDELISACAATNGVVCINGIGIFLGDNDAGVATFANHIDYVVQRVGPAHVGIGLDYVFDQHGLNSMLAEHANVWPRGFGYEPGIRFLGPEQLPYVTDELLRRGYAESDIRAVLGENLLRVARDVWR